MRQDIISIFSSYIISTLRNCLAYRPELVMNSFTVIVRLRISPICPSMSYYQAHIVTHHDSNAAHENALVCGRT